MTVHTRDWHLDRAEQLLLGVDQACKNLRQEDPSEVYDAFPDVHAGLELSVRRAEAHLRLAELIPDIEARTP